MQTYDAAYDWGSDTLKACRDILVAADTGADIVIHRGRFNADDERHVTTVSRACEDSNVELVIRGVPDPGQVYPHITFIEEM